MPTTYDLCGDDVTAAANELMKTVHTTLEKVGVELHYRFAHAAVSEATGKPVGPAIKQHGRARTHKVKINSADLRSQGLKDATVTLDGDTWRERTSEEQRAIIDDALESIVVVCDKETGDFLTDDLGRPKLRIKEADLYTEGYEAVLKRNGQAALEAKQLAALWEVPSVQGMFSFR